MTIKPTWSGSSIPSKPFKSSRSSTSKKFSNIQNESNLEKVSSHSSLYNTKSKATNASKNFFTNNSNQLNTDKLLPTYADLQPLKEPPLNQESNDKIEKNATDNGTKIKFNRDNKNINSALPDKVEENKSIKPEDKPIKLFKSQSEFRTWMRKHIHTVQVSNERTLAKLAANNKSAHIQDSTFSSLINTNIDALAQASLSNNKENGRPEINEERIAKNLCKLFPSLNSPEVITHVTACLQELSEQSSSLAEEIKNEMASDRDVKHPTVEDKLLFIAMLLGLFIIKELLNETLSSTNNAEIHDLNRTINEFIDDIVVRYDASIAAIKSQSDSLVQSYENLEKDILDKLEPDVAEAIVKNLNEMKKDDIAVLEKYLNSLATIKQKALDYKLEDTNTSNDINRRFAIHSTMFMLSLNPIVATFVSAAIDIATNPQITKTQAEEIFLKSMKDFSTVSTEKELQENIKEEQNQELEVFESLRHRFKDLPKALSRGVIGTGTEEFLNRFVSYLLKSSSLHKFTPILGELATIMLGNNLNPYIQVEELNRLKEKEDIQFYIKKTNDQTLQNITNAHDNVSEFVKESEKNLLEIKTKAFANTEKKDDKSETDQVKQKSLVLSIYEKSQSIFQSYFG